MIQVLLQSVSAWCVQPDTGFGAPPENIVSGAGPLLLDQVIHFSLVQAIAKIFTQILK